MHVISLTISMEYGKSSGSTVMELGMLTTCSRATPQQKWHTNLAACMAWMQIGQGVQEHTH